MLSKRMKEEKEEFFKLKNGFNNYCMREMGFDIDENDYLVDPDEELVLTIKGKYIKYNDEILDPIMKFDELDLNLLENSRLFSTLFQVYITKYMKSHPEVEVVGYHQSNLKGSNSGVFCLNYKLNGDNTIHKLESEIFKNNSVRIFNLICKLNERTSLYDFNRLDVIIDKSTRKKWREE